MNRRRNAFRLYARVAAAAFFLVAAYTLLVKAPGGELERDWVHTALHGATGALAVYGGWFARGEGLAKALTAAVGLGYGALGVIGWFVDGLFMQSTVRVPLDAAENVFHLVLSIGAGVAFAVRHRLLASTD